MRLKSFNQIIGNDLEKAILINQLKNKNISPFIFIKGESGTGKSSLAEVLAMTATCEKHGLEPCMECQTCKSNIVALESTGVSRNIKKVNMGTLINKEDINNLIKNIFTLEALPDEKTFYILEEVHKLGDKQDMLLEELERIQENVHIIMCTSEYNKIAITLKTRAKLTLDCKRLNNSSALILINKLLAENNLVNVKEVDKKVLLSATKNNARRITNFIETFSSYGEEKNFGYLVREQFSRVENKHYISLLSVMDYDFPSYVQFIDSLANTIKLQDLVNNFYEFMTEFVFYRYCGRDSMFHNKEKGLLNQITEDLGNDKIEILFNQSAKKVSDESEAIRYLISLRQKVNNIKVTKNKSKVDAVEETVKAKENELEKEREEIKVDAIKETEIEDTLRSETDIITTGIEGFDSF